MSEKSSIDVPMPIVTPRLILRAPKESDGQAWYEAKLESYDELYKWRIWVADTPREFLSVGQNQKFCKERMELFQLREKMLLMAFDRHTGKFIGDTGINSPDWKLRLFRTGYWVRTSEMGKGYATEMAIAVARYVFLALKANKLSITHADGNNASARIIDKVGYEKEGVLRQCHEISDGRVVDEHHYGLLGLDHVPELDVTWGETR